MELEQALQDSQYREQQLELTNSSLQRHLERITEEKEEREKEAVSWFNALEVNTAHLTSTQSTHSVVHIHKFDQHRPLKTDCESSCLSRLKSVCPTAATHR